MVEKPSSLAWFNRLSPKEFRTARVLEGQSFGEHHRQKLDVYAPKNIEQKLPVLLFIYGGGWDSGLRAEYAFVGRAFAAAGFVVVIADYRVVPEAHFPDFLEDGAAALNWIDREILTHGGNPERLFLMGHSAGAYNAVMLGLNAPRFGGPNLGGRIKGVVGLSGPYDFYPFDVPASIAAFSQAPEPEMTQPVNLVHAEAPPMFLGHGTKDEICMPRNTMALAKRLREDNVPVVERHYTGLAHPGPLLTLSRLLRWRAPIYREVVAFMRAQI